MNYKKKGINITRSDFYSEIPTIQEIREAKKGPKLDRVFPENIILLRFLEQLEEFAHEFEAPANNISDKNFFSKFYILSSTFAAKNTLKLSPISILLKIKNSISLRIIK